MDKMKRRCMVLWMMTVAISVATVSCDRGTSLQLKRVESILESDPITADSILSSMPSPSKAADRALYAVLKTQADYKNLKVATSDSLILTATSYYGSRHKDYHTAMAWYSLGCIYSDMQNDAAAINAYLKALDLFPDTLVRYFALTEQNLGKHYLNQMRYAESEAILKRCLKNALRLHEDVLSSNVRYRLGQNALYQQKYSIADSIFSSISVDPQSSSIRRRQSFLNQAKIRLHADKDFSAAMSLADRYLYEITDSDESGVGYSVKADIFYAMENFDSAYHYYSKSLKYLDELYTVCDNYGKLAVLSILQGKADDALSYQSYHDRLVDSIYFLQRASEIEQIRFDNNVELMKRDLMYSHRRFILICVLSVIVIVTLLATLYLYNRRKNERDLLKRYSEMVSQTEKYRLNSVEIVKAHMLEKESHENNVPRETVLELYRNKLSVSKELFSKTHAFSILSTKILDNDYSFSSEERTLVINQLTESFIDTILDMNLEVPGISREDILIYLLSSMGISNKLISPFVNLTESGVRKRRLRLSDKAPVDFLGLF